MSDLRIANITIDCSGDASALAGFYAELLRTGVDEGASPYFATVGRGGRSVTLMFVRVPDRTPGKNSVHVDLQAADLPAEVERAVGLGAKHVKDFDEHGVVWSTLADPEGNLFDIGASS
ncbi:VOC family protein [Dactylosporangium sp. NPDC051485]|uniref:VOC family protein n=1 Tax=Dactylosporangium sp. NPDC051485 TaxID=3154846 RepID=UPI003435EC5F